MSALRRIAVSFLTWVVETIPKGVLLARENFLRFQANGFHVTPVHFYQPLPDTRELPESLWDGPREMRGVDMAPDRQLELLDELKRYKAEYEADWIQGPAFGTPDADMLWAMVRRQRPKRVIEVGTGTSTTIIAGALAQNLADDPGRTCEFYSIDPYPNEALLAGIPGGSRVVKSPVQDVALADFEKLERGDILFVDSSHVVAIGSDVTFEILEILPRLAPGVVIHFHDIHLPYEYRRDWVMEKFVFWNEAYLLQAFLAYNDSFRILISGCYLDAYHPDSLAAAFDRYDPGRRPGSIWFERVR